MTVLDIQPHTHGVKGMAARADDRFDNRIVGDEPAEGGRLLTLLLTYREDPRLKFPITIVVPEGLPDYTAYREQVRQKILDTMRVRVPPAQ